MLGAFKMIAGGAAGSSLKPQDVFDVNIYTGTGTTQTITTGFDPDLIWTKARSFGRNHALVNKIRGLNKVLESNTDNGETTTSAGQDITATSSTGYTLGTNNYTNASTETYGSWSFKEAPKFLDIVTWTGDGSGGRVINHGLGGDAGMILVKRVDTLADWIVWHRSASAAARLNWTDAFSAHGTANTADGYVQSANTTSFTLTGGQSTLNAVNANGGLYIAYVFAHDASAEGVIQCGTYAGNAGSPPSINLGWRPQFLMIKNATSGGYDWMMFDQARGFGAVDEATLRANSNAAEFTNNYATTSSTGFQLVGFNALVNANGTNYVYLAIREPI